MRRFGVLWLAMSLAAAACTGATEQGTATSAPSETGLGTDEMDDLPDEVAAFLKEESDLSTLSLSADPPVVAPGDRVTVRGFAGPGGSMTLYSADGTAADVPVTGAAVSVEIAADAPEGLHAILAESPGGFPAVATFRVATGPYVEISLAGGDLLVNSAGVPLDRVAALRAGLGDDAVFFEAFPDGLLVPMPGEPTALLSDYLETPLEVPPTLDGPIALLVVGEEPGEFGLQSNTLDLSRCDAPPVLIGDLGGPGEVRAVWSGPRPGSTGLESINGSYRLETESGVVAVTEYPHDGEPLTLAVTASCGLETDVAESAASVVGGFSPQGLLDDTWTGELAGMTSLAVDEGVAICSLSDDILEVSLYDDLDFSVALALALDPYGGPGAYQVQGLLLTDAGDVSEGPIGLTVEEPADGAVAGVFTGNVVGDSGSTAVQGAFRCALERFSGLGAPQPVLAAYQGGGGHSACRIGLVDMPADAPSVGAVATRKLAAGTPLIEWNTSDDIEGLLGAAVRDQQAGGDGDDEIRSARRLQNPDFLIKVELNEIPTFVEHRWSVKVVAFDVHRSKQVGFYFRFGPTRDSVRSLPGFGGFVADVAQAGICGFVEPEEASLQKGEEQEFVYEVVDLSDAPLSGAQVEITERVDGEFSDRCGTITPMEGTTDASGFNARFTAAEDPDRDCTEHPRFSARYRAPTGEVQTESAREGGDATIRVGTKWEYEAALTYQSRDGALTWTYGAEEPGFFFVREHGGIVGGAQGSFDGLRSCEVHENDVLTFKEDPTRVTASWVSYLSGKFVKDEYFEFRFDGAAFDSNWPPLPAECADQIFSPMAESFLEFVGFRPDTLTLNPVRLSPEPRTVTFRVDTGTFLGGEFVMTIRPAEPEEDG